jgi:hypothetical protein
MSVHQLTRHLWASSLISAAVIPLCAIPRACAQDRVPATDALKIEKVADPAGWNILEADQLVAGYVLDSNGKPILYPLVSPSGHRMTRDFPMKDANKNERGDHDHHRSVWLTHGDVNGIDFWLDDAHCGKIVHRDGTAEIDQDGAAVLITHNDWLDPDGKRILSDTRRFSLRNVDGRRLLDCDFLLKATDGDVNFGDTKEGSFGVRVAGTMKVDAKQGGKITNAEGETDKDAWGKKSAWVDYSGPVDGQRVGITIHDHPSSFGYPCRWHVRTYGLFAANPFGVHHFTGGDKTRGVVLKEGDQMRLNYRVVLHEGEFGAELAGADSKQYANDPRPVLE